MLPPLPPRRRPRPGRGARRLAVLGLLAAAAGVALGGLWFWTGEWTPVVAWTRGDAPVLVFEGERLATPPLVDSGEVLMAFDDFRARIDPDAFWDREAGLLILSTRGRLVVFPRDQVTAFVNDEPTRITVPVRVRDGTPYVPLSPLAAFYGLVVRYEAATHTAVVDRTSSPRLLGEATERAWLRTGPSRFSPRLAEVAEGASLRVLGEEEGFYRVELRDGRLGYLPKAVVELQSLTAAAGPEPMPPPPL
ncbi:MAG: SH3 domain-containing protein, partial [Clostridia bacterium]|nr:SH3 domain-containing protein [Clostridia bacterium]